MKIESVTAVDLDVGFQRQKLQTTRIASPMSRWPEYAENRASWMWPTRRTFVRIDTTEGITGWGFTNGGEVTALIINRQLGPLIEGLPANDIDDIWERMFHSTLPNNRSGYSMMAISAVDIALWDIRQKAEGRQLAKLLGQTEDRTKMDAYITTSQPEAAASLPWWGLKAAMPYSLSDGAVGLESNVAVVQRFRDAAGPDRPVMVDAFMAWDADYTIDFAARAEETNLYWIEDPLPPQDLRGMEKVRATMDPAIKMALGNFAFHRWDCETLLRAGVVDILQPDVCWAGGITECRRILEMAAVAGVKVILHNTCEQPWALSLAAADAKMDVVEHVDRGETSLLYALLGTPAEFASGQVRLPDTVTGNTPQSQIETMLVA